MSGPELPPDKKLFKIKGMVRLGDSNIAIKQLKYIA